MNYHETLRFARRTLPHWLVADASYIVTLRLAGTLPKAVIEAMQRERESVMDAEDARHGR